MNDLPSSIIVQQAHARSMSGEELEVFGKQAASKYISGECKNLNESVVETIKKAGLSPEQVRRVVEFANTDAFLQEFRKEGQTHKVIEFVGGPASYSEVLKDLNDGGGGSVFDSGSNDYSFPPPDLQKLSSLNQDALGLEEQKLAVAFRAEQVDLPYAEPYRDVLEMKEKLAASYEEIGTELNQLEVQFMDGADHLYNAVKQAAMNGTNLGEIVSAWSITDKNPDFVKVAFQYMTPRLLGDGVFFSKTILSDSLMKTASVGSVNIEHPVVKDFESFCEVLTKLAECRAMQSEIEKGLDSISFFLKAAAGEEAALTAGEVAGKGLNAAKKGWNVARETTKAWGNAAEKGLAATGHPTVGKVVKGALVSAPYVGAAGAALNVKHRADRSPTVQQGLGILRSNLPYGGMY